MTIRKLHRLLGVLMLLPLLAWAVTGAIFFLKPGYAGAYEILQIKTYPLGSVAPIRPEPSWLEYRRLKTMLGEHLLVRTEEGWRQLDVGTLQPRPAPQGEELMTLFADALPEGSSRYGHLSHVEGVSAATDTGISLTLDWNRLTLSQRGRDTARIDRLYKIHYLQWTGVAAIDKVLGASGVLLVLMLSLFGARLLLRRPRLS
jgi:hypothetical protein